MRILSSGIGSHLALSPIQIIMLAGILSGEKHLIGIFSPFNIWEKVLEKNYKMNETAHNKNNTNDQSSLRARLQHLMCRNVKVI